MKPEHYKKLSIALTIIFASILALNLLTIKELFRVQRSTIAQTAQNDFLLRVNGGYLDQVTGGDYSKYLQKIQANK